MVSLLASVAAVALLAALFVPALTRSSGTTAGTQTAAAPLAARDAAAQTLATTAQLAMTTYAASSDSGYTGATPSALNAIEPTLTLASATEPYLASVTGTQSAFTVVVEDPATHNTFEITDSGGTVARTCTTAGVGGCPAGGSW